MTGASAVLAELLADCDAHGIRLMADSDGGLIIDAPQAALTPDMLARLKAHKADVLAMLRPALSAAPTLPVETRDALATSTKPVCRCGATMWRDVPIHCGESVRRDCGRCGRFLNFPLWYGNITGQIVQ